MIWEHFASVLRRDSKRAVPITKLSAESVYLMLIWLYIH